MSAIRPDLNGFITSCQKQADEVRKTLRKAYSASVEKNWISRIWCWLFGDSNLSKIATCEAELEKYESQLDMALRLSKVAQKCLEKQRTLDAARTAQDSLTTQKSVLDRERAQLLTTKDQLKNQYRITYGTLKVLSKLSFGYGAEDPDEALSKNATLLASKENEIAELEGQIDVANERVETLEEEKAGFEKERSALEARLFPQAAASSAAIVAPVAQASVAGIPQGSPTFTGREALCMAKKIFFSALTSSNHPEFANTIVEKILPENIDTFTMGSDGVFEIQYNEEHRGTIRLGADWNVPSVVSRDVTLTAAKTMKGKVDVDQHTIQFDDGVLQGATHIGIWPISTSVSVNFNEVTVTDEGQAILTARLGTTAQSVCKRISGHDINPSLKFTQAEFTTTFGPLAWV